MTGLTAEQYHRIHGIINFMREATAIIDPEKALAGYGIDDISAFSEGQLTYILVKEGIQNPEIAELFVKLKDLSTNEIRLINQDNEIFNKFVLIAGGLFYIKALKRLIKKSDILEAKKILTEPVFDFIFNFKDENGHVADYPLTKEFEMNIYAIGYYIYDLFIVRLDPLIKKFLFEKVELEKPKKSIEHLTISNEYALKLASIAQNYIIDNLSE